MLGQDTLEQIFLDFSRAANEGATMKTISLFDYNNTWSNGILNLLFFLTLGFASVLYVMVGIFLWLARLLMCRRGMPQAVHLGTMLKLAATPFGRVLRTTLPKKPAACHIIANLFWMPIGLALGAAHLLMGLVLGLTVVLIPFSYHHFALRHMIW